MDVRHKGFDAQVRPDLRGDDFEREVLEYADERTVELMQRYDISGAFRGDTDRIQLLTVLGWKPYNESPYVLNRTEINLASLPALPEGFSFQSATGVEDAAALAEVHNAAFGQIWTPDI